MILVTGAAGKTGKAVVHALVKAGLEIRALVHRSEQVEVLKASGAVEVIHGDMLSENTLMHAAKGMQAVYHICPNVNPDETILGAFVIEASRYAHVDHFVYHSVLHPQTEAMTHHWKKLQVEELLLESDLNFTILQPAAYMQNLLGYWNQIAQDHRYAVPYPVQTRLGLVDLEDVAAVAAIVLAEPQKHQSAIYELVGTVPLSQIDVAKVLSKYLGFTVQVEETSLDNWEKQARANDMQEYALDTLVKMFKYYAKFGMGGNPNILTCLLGRNPVDLSGFVQRTLQNLPL